MDGKAASPQQRGADLEILGNDGVDDTLVNDHLDDRISLEDWSSTGRGSHIDFDDHEEIPLKQG